MNIIHAREPLPKSIFLAGPTPRSQGIESWRPEALRILTELEFNGTIFVPEPEDTGDWTDAIYDEQIDWEWEALAISTVVVFWVPRELENMPGFTTNVEFGMMADTRKCILGYPQEAKKMRYLDHMAQRYGITVFRTLESVLRIAVQRTKD